VCGLVLAGDGWLARAGAWWLQRDRDALPRAASRARSRPDRARDCAPPGARGPEGRVSALPRRPPAALAGPVGAALWFWRRPTAGKGDWGGQGAENVPSASYVLT
jgi:hypothetical protein